MSEGYSFFGLPPLQEWNLESIELARADLKVEALKRGDWFTDQESLLRAQESSLGIPDEENLLLLHLRFKRQLMVKGLLETLGILDTLEQIEHAKKENSDCILFWESVGQTYAAEADLPVVATDSFEKVATVHSSLENAGDVLTSETCLNFMRNLSKEDKDKVSRNDEPQKDDKGTWCHVGLFRASLEARSFIMRRDMVLEKFLDHVDSLLRKKELLPPNLLKNSMSILGDKSSSEFSARVGAIDFEMIRGELSEIGLTVKYRGIVSSYHVLIRTSAKWDKGNEFLNRRGSFSFGTSKLCSLEEAILVMKPLIVSCDFLVSHDDVLERKVLKGCFGLDPVIEDTQDYLGPLSLENALILFQISYNPDLLHNGGNDAHYIMKVWDQILSRGIAKKEKKKKKEKKDKEKKSKKEKAPVPPLILSLRDGETDRSLHSRGSLRIRDDDYCSTDFCSSFAWRRCFLCKVKLCQDCCHLEGCNSVRLGNGSILPIPPPIKYRKQKAASLAASSASLSA